MRTIIAIFFLMLFISSSIAQDVQYWTNYDNSAVAGAAWCITKDNNKSIFKKSMTPPSVCSSTILKMGVLSSVTEHDLGKFAVKLACVGDKGMAAQGLASALLSLALPSADEGALGALAICQCHNPTAITDIYNQRNIVLSSLRQWGGCAGQTPSKAPQQQTFCHFQGGRYGPMVPPGQIGESCPLRQPDGSLFGVGIVGY